MLVRDDQITHVHAPAAPRHLLRNLQLLGDSGPRRGCVRRQDWEAARVQAPNTKPSWRRRGVSPESGVDGC